MSRSSLLLGFGGKVSDKERPQSWDVDGILSNPLDTEGTFFCNSGHLFRKCPERLQWKQTKDLRAAVLYKKWSKSAVLLDVTRKSQKAQLEDPAIKPILEKKLNSEDRPSWQEIAPESPATKRYWALWDSLHLKDGVQYRKWESDDGSFCRWQLILLKSRIQEVLRETHDSSSGGHFGVMKTLSKIRERFYWDRLRTDVEKWCRDCHACGARKGPKTRTNGRTRAKSNMFCNRGVKFVITTSQQSTFASGLLDYTLLLCRKFAAKLPH
ncbi:hypothetical protein AVEN_261152-1 [Araneus ventricosus]|uniref:Integrase zinc-binding domain-containing protein n=1 Tax=Araneus ventricosus TaxID=182803 RepID=A0A4Y2IZM3_ARAVE|nr:hypothetical protein AVEN_261152-1 [Araneus ventricosus]